MKKLLTSFFIIILAFMLVSFSKNKSVTVEGRLGLYGNEPFTYLGLTTSDTDFYVIQTKDRALYKEIYELQLMTVEITGTDGGKDGLGNKVIIAEEYKIINEEKKDK